MSRPRWLRREGPSFLQLHRARRISVVRAEERRKRAEARAAAAEAGRRRACPAGHRARCRRRRRGRRLRLATGTRCEVVTRHGETGVRGHLYPVVIDGIIVAASMVVLDAARHRRGTRRCWRGALLGAGIVVTLAANVTYGVAFGLVRRPVGRMARARFRRLLRAVDDAGQSIGEARADRTCRHRFRRPSRTPPKPRPRPRCAPRSPLATRGRSTSSRHSSGSPGPRRRNYALACSPDPTGTHPNRTHPTPHKPPAAG